MKIVFLSLILLGSCDPTARTGGEGGAAPVTGAPSGDRAGRELETCASTRDCGTGLRCVEAACRPARTSRVGELLWASARRSAERGAAAAAVTAFQQAAQQFEAEDLPVPAQLLCDHGRFLARKPDAQSGEQAARLLHRCVLGTPPGSRRYEQATAALVELEPRGLDPSLIGRDAPADSYLVNKPTPPSADVLTIKVTRSVPAADKGYDAWVAVLEGGDAHLALAKCFASQWEKTFATRMVVSLHMKLKPRGRASRDADLAPGTLDLTTDGTDDGKCVRGALGALATSWSKAANSTGPWQGSVTISVSAP